MNKFIIGESELRDLLKYAYLLSLLTSTIDLDEYVSEDEGYAKLDSMDLSTKFERIE